MILQSFSILVLILVLIAAGGIFAAEYSANAKKRAIETLKVFNDDKPVYCFERMNVIVVSKELGFTYDAEKDEFIKAKKDYQVVSCQTTKVD